MDSIPIWLLFVGSIAVVMLALEVGYRLGAAVHRRFAGEKAAAASGISSAILGLAAFMLAFTFGLVSERFDMKKGLVREDANAIRVAWQRSDFLPEKNRAEAATLLHEYLDVRLKLADEGKLDPERVSTAAVDTRRIQGRLWNMAVANARLDMTSEMAALYVEALNEMARVHARRVAIGIQLRVPIEIWITLYLITILGMMSMGYHTAIAESNRSRAQPILALAFALVIVLIAALDRPGSGVLRVTQQPLIDLQSDMAAAAGGR